VYRNRYSVCEMIHELLPARKGNFQNGPSTKSRARSQRPALYMQWRIDPMMEMTV
jgi:hypothetical protein